MIIPRDCDLPEKGIGSTEGRHPYKKKQAMGKVVLFRPSKTTFKRVLRNQIPIENDRENDEYDDENGDNFDVR